MKFLEFIKQNPILVGILLFGAIIRFYHIDFQSVWLDEIHTINESNPNIPFSEVYQTIISGEQMPPLYFYTVYFLFKLFGYSTFVVRIYSAIIGVVSLYAMYILGREMMNKKTGLIAAMLLCVNYFHLFYSQESRPYIFLLLFTILSFYRLLLYIKNPVRKNAILFGVFSALMLHFHFFGLFVLFSQYLILLFFLLLSEKENRVKFFINSLISGVIVLVLFAPALPILINITKIKEFWIPAPTQDSYTLIFKEFFGNSELILTLLVIITIFYFLRLSKEKDFPLKYYAVVQNKTILSFVIIMPWVLIVVLIPLIRSYMAVPMLISRYFIVLLPAIILLIAIAITQFRHKILLFSILATFVIFSMTDIIVVKRYYKAVIKTQFREASQFIKDNNNNEPVFTSLPWYFNFFLNNKETKMTIVDMTLENHVNEMIQDSLKRKPFWYIDAHSRPYTVSETAQKYLDENFVVENNQDLYDIWTKHYVLTSSVSPTVDLAKFLPLKDKNGAAMSFWIDAFEANAEIIKTSGWAYLDGIDTKDSEIEVVLINNGIATKMLRKKVLRLDVNASSDGTYNLENSGFSAEISANKLSPGVYKLGIIVKNKISNKEGLVMTDKIYTKS